MKKFTSTKRWHKHHNFCWKILIIVQAFRRHLVSPNVWYDYTHFSRRKFTFRLILTRCRLQVMCNCSATALINIRVVCYRDPSFHKIRIKLSFHAVSGSAMKQGETESHRRRNSRHHRKDAEVYPAPTRGRWTSGTTEISSESPLVASFRYGAFLTLLPYHPHIYIKLLTASNLKIG